MKLLFCEILMMLFCFVSCDLLHFKTQKDTSNSVAKTAYSVWLPDLSLEAKQNGINPSEAKDFWKNWNLVTTRYRVDNAEQRFVYANSIAWQAMTEKKTVYPAGSIFAKLALHVENDPAFPGSMEPKGFSRIQLMKKMEKGYRTSGNWSYALFLVNPKRRATQEDEPKACHGCHSLVPERDFVFSRPAFFHKPELTDENNLMAKFTLLALGVLPQKEANFLKRIDPNLPAALFYFQMPLFSGSLNESIVPLTQFAIKKKQPFLLVDPKIENRFVLAVPQKKEARCTEKVAIYNSIGKKGNQKNIQVEFGYFCNGNYEWHEPIKVITQ